MRLKIFVLIRCLTASAITFGQPALNVGKALPDFALTNVTNFHARSATYGDFKGKWLFIDFWSTGCSACILSFPHVNMLQKELSNKLTYLMIGINDRKFNTGIENLYSKFQRKYGLRMVAAYDSILSEKWNVPSLPHIIVVDPTGVIRTISDGRDFTVEKVRSLVEGKDVSFYQKATDKPEFNQRNSSGLKSKVIYQSLLTEWNGEEQQAYMGIKDVIKYLKTTAGMNYAMVPLKWLYGLAYTGYYTWDLPHDSLYGKFYPEPVLELKDKTPFEFDFDSRVGKGTYNYSLVIPPGRATVAQVMEIMKHDLKDTFGYSVSIELRPMPAWKLVMLNEVAEKLKTKGGPFYFAQNNPSTLSTGFTARNISVGTLLSRVMFYVEDGQPPYFDETGIEGNIDISFNALLTDWTEIRNELRRNGFELVKGTREMQTIVIRDQ